MRMNDLIVKKRDGEKLSKEEIHFIINGYVNNEIPDYQMSAFLMAIYYSGMDEEETLNFTFEMADSGEKLDLSSIEGVTADKHSTGGVGDKTSLIIGPMVASLGVTLAKMSGRGLGHTGGTIDKLESIEGFNTAISLEQFMENLKNVKFSIVGQMKNLAPADKKIYALRDVTGTVDIIPLIASSIMSKKLAAGSDVIVLDVKTGSGAFMKSYEDAEKLANIMVKIGNMAGKKVYAVITDMNEPLGENVGNSLEVIEAINVLSGKGDKRLLDVSLKLGAIILLGVGKVQNLEDGEKLLKETIDNGNALKKFAEFVKAQGGNDSFVYNTELFPKAAFQDNCYLEKSGYLLSCNTNMIGKASLVLGGGREKKDTIIDLSVGVKIKYRLGEYIDKNNPIAVVYGNNKEKILEAKKYIENAYQVSETFVKPEPIIKKIITN